MSRVSVEVERSADEVFAFATDPTKFDQWQEGVVSGSMESKGEPHVGDLCRTTRRIGGSERPSTSKLVRYQAPREWSVHGIDGPIRASVDLDVEPLDDHRARVTIAVDFEGHGIGKLLVPLVVQRQARKEMPRNMDRLKALIESGPLASWPSHNVHALMPMSERPTLLLCVRKQTVTPTRFASWPGRSASQ